MTPDELRAMTDTDLVDYVAMIINTEETKRDQALTLMVLKELRTRADANQEKS